MPDAPNLVLVHGAWADGSCWSAVIERLQADGVTVTAPQFPETSLDADVARLRQVLRQQDGPTVVAGHSYGGQIITALGADAPNVVGLGYVAAFGLDEGESIGALLAQGPPPPALAQPATSTSRGSPGCGEDDFVATSPPTSTPSRPGSCTRSSSRCTRTLREVMGAPAWRSLPSWYLVAQDDEAIAPDGERLFAQRMGATTVEVASGHLAMVSHPDDVATLLKGALDAAAVAG